VRIGKSAKGIGCAPIAVQIAVVDFTRTCATSRCASRSRDIRIISTRASFGNSRARVDINSRALSEEASAEEKAKTFRIRSWIVGFDAKTSLSFVTAAAVEAKTT